MVRQIECLGMISFGRVQYWESAGLDAAGALGKRPERGLDALRNLHIDANFHWPYLTCDGFWAAIMDIEVDHFPAGLRRRATDVAGGALALLRHYGHATSYAAHGQ